MKSYFDDTTKQVMQGFELVASQLRVKLAAGGSSSSHCVETHKTIIFEDFDAWVYGFNHNNPYVNSLSKNQQSISMKETKEPPSFVGGEIEEELHQED